MRVYNDSFCSSLAHWFGVSQIMWGVCRVLECTLEWDPQTTLENMTFCSSHIPHWVTALGVALTRRISFFSSVWQTLITAALHVTSIHTISRSMRLFLTKCSPFPDPFKPDLVNPYQYSLFCFYLAHHLSSFFSIICSTFFPFCPGLLMLPWFKP